MGLKNKLISSHYSNFLKIIFLETCLEYLMVLMQKRAESKLLCKSRSLMLHKRQNLIRDPFIIQNTLAMAGPTA